MNVIAINGSPRKEGNTALALKLMAEELAKENIGCEIIQVGHLDIRGCAACGVCKKTGRCVFDDIVNETAEKIAAADGFILGCPAHYGGIPGAMKSFLDRLFYPGSKRFQYKAATAIAVCRRTGALDVVHGLYNYLSLAQAVLAPTQYWPALYGRLPGEVLQDEEGKQIIRRSAQSLAWVLKMIDATRGTIPLPPAEERVTTHFIR